MSKSRITAIALSVTALATSALSGCSSGSDSASTGGGSGSGNQIVLGFTATLTGDFASYGVNVRNGAQLAIDDINRAGGLDGKKLRLKIEDDQGKPSNGPVVAQKLCDDGSVKAVLGYSFSSVALASIPVVNQCKLPVVASSVTSPKLSGISPYFFRNVPTDAAQGLQYGDYAASTLGLKKIAVLYQQDDYGSGAATAFIKGVEASGGEVTYKAAYQVGTTAFQSQIASAMGSGADALYVGGFYTEAAKIAQQARAAGFEGQLLGIDGSLANELMKLGGPAVEGMMAYGTFVPSIQTATVQKFVAAYRHEFGDEPTSAAALGYDALQLVARAIKDGGDTRAGIEAALPKTRLTDGITGANSFDSKHDRIAKIYFVKVSHGQFIQAQGES